MTSFEKRTRMDVPARELFDWHARPGAFERLAPPWDRIEVVERSGSIRDGDRLVMRLHQGPAHLTWIAEHRNFIDGRQFQDVQVKGPFARWEHTHRFEADDERHSTLVDHIDYALPLGPLGHLGDGQVQAMLARMFAFRHARTASDLRRHARHAARPRLKVGITGASGLIGTALSAFLTTGGHEVRHFVRRTPTAPHEVPWSVTDGQLDPRHLEGLDAVVHLAGENIASGRWNEGRMQAIRDSRVDGTRLIAESMRRMDKPPKSLLSASAIGYYGETMDAPLDETSPAGQTQWLARVCQEWEAATKPAEEAGIRVAHLRIGIVLSPAGGMLRALLPVFQAGLGARAGTGQQWVSWIGIDDTIAAIYDILFDAELAGPVNLTAPNPVTNATFAKVLARVLHRPAALRVPAPAMQMVLGRDMARETVLSGQRVLPSKLASAGFSWDHEDLESCLRFILGRQGP